MVEAINGFLGFRERTGEDLSLADFREAENVFFSWGNDHAKDVLQAGPVDRNFTDDGIAAEISRLPLATNVNYLREFPAERLGLAPLSAARLANPFDWIVAGEAYAQLHEESPAPAGLGRPGPGADRHRRGARQQPVPHRRPRPVRRSRRALPAAFNALQAAIADFEIEFRAIRTTGCSRSTCSAASTRSRTPTRSMPRWTELQRCGGGELGGRERRRPAAGQHQELRLLRAAAGADRHNLADPGSPGIGDRTGAS